MKASIKFRENRQPLVRAKVPTNFLGLPFLSGVSASRDDARDLRLDLATAFESGPSVRLSCRPMDASNPLSLAIKSGAGPLFSPLGSPFAVTAEFNLVGGAVGSPFFSLHFKPRRGDFSIRKTMRSTPSAAPVASEPPAMVDPAVDADEEEGDNVVREPAHHLGSIGKGISGLFSGFEVATRSVLPLPGATVNFQWGVRVPQMMNGLVSGSSQLGKLPLPLLTMNKISVEKTTTTKTKADVAASDSAYNVRRRRQLEEDLQAAKSLYTDAVELEKVLSQVSTGRKFGSRNRPVPDDGGAAEKSPEGEQQLF